MNRIATLVGAIAFVLLAVVNVNLKADPSCYKRCGCGDTLNGESCQLVRPCNGTEDGCMWCNCSQHKSCGSGSGYGDHNWNDECSAVPYCELQSCGSGGDPE